MASDASRAAGWQSVQLMRPHLEEHMSGHLCGAVPAEWLAGHHHHLVCRECGTVIDMDVTNALEAALEGVAAQAVAGHGFQSDGHRLTLEGRCAVCADA